MNAVLASSTRRFGSPIDDVSLFRILRVDAFTWLPFALFTFWAASALTSGWRETMIPNLSYPDVYSGDGLAAAWWIQRIVDGTGFFHSERNGYPFASEILDYPMSDAGNFVVLKSIGMLAGSWWETMNLYYLLGFPVTFVASYGVLRLMQVSRPLAIAGSVVFTMLPYHFLRFQTFKHVFLTWYFVVPVFFLLSWRIYAKRALPNKANALGLVLETVLLLVLASFGVYYAVFGIIVLFVGGLAGYVRCRSQRTVAAACFSIVFVALGMGLNAAPNLWHVVRHGINVEVAHRALNESEVYGLKLVQMLLPRGDHRITSLADTTQRYEALAPLVNENSSSALGMAGSAGLLLIAGVILWRLAGRAVDDRLSFLALVVLVTGAIATVGGLSALFATLVSPSLRGWNRISVFVAFGAIATAMIALDALLARITEGRRITFAAIPLAFVIAAFGTLDQTVEACDSCNQKIKTAFQQDREFIASIEALLPSGAGVYQLPYMPFPEVARQHQLEAYDLAVGALQSTTLRWSYAGIKGREGDLFFRALVEEPMNAQLDVLRRLQFSGIYVDRRGYADGGRAIEREIMQALGAGPELVRADNKVAFYRINPLSHGLPPYMTAQTVMRLADFEADRHGARYAATLEQGIDLRRPGLPRFVRNFNGLSAREAWGRWSDANVAPLITIEFNDPLPATFTLVLRGQAFGPNVGKPVLLRVGTVVETIALTAQMAEHRVGFRLSDTAQRKLEIVPPIPVSPRDLGLGDDSRRLGVGLDRIWLDR